MRSWSFYVGLFALFFLGNPLVAQDLKQIVLPDTAEIEPLRFDINDDLSDIPTLEMVSKLDPRKSALFSAVFPGLGQIYNGDYWKLPVVYAGGIVIGQMIYFNHNMYNSFNNAMIADSDGSEATANPYPRFNRQSLQRNRDFFRRNRDFMIILGIGYYMLHIVEAHIAAHLKEFSVNDDLSMRLKPSVEPLPISTPAIGFGIAITFK